MKVFSFENKSIAKKRLAKNLISQALIIFFFSIILRDINSISIIASIVIIISVARSLQHKNREAFAIEIDDKIESITFSTSNDWGLINEDKFNIENIDYKVVLNSNNDLTRILFTKENRFLCTIPKRVVKQSKKEINHLLNNLLISKKYLEHPVSEAFL